MHLWNPNLTRFQAVCQCPWQHNNETHPSPNLQYVWVYFALPACELGAIPELVLTKWRFPEGPAYAIVTSRSPTHRCRLRRTAGTHTPLSQVNEMSILPICGDGPCCCCCIPFLVKCVRLRDLWRRWAHTFCVLLSIHNRQKKERRRSSFWEHKAIYEGDCRSLLSK